MAGSSARLTQCVLPRVGEGWRIGRLFRTMDGICAKKRQTAVNTGVPGQLGIRKFRRRRAVEVYKTTHEPWHHDYQSGDGGITVGQITTPVCGRQHSQRINKNAASTPVANRWQQSAFRQGFHQLRSSENRGATGKIPHKPWKGG